MSAKSRALADYEAAAKAGDVSHLEALIAEVAAATADEQTDRTAGVKHGQPSAYLHGDGLYELSGPEGEAYGRTRDEAVARWNQRAWGEKNAIRGKLEG